MLTGERLEQAIKTIMARFDEVNSFYIAKIAAQIKKIGELSQSSINMMIVMADMGADMLEVEEKLRLATALNQKELYAVYQKAVNEVYTDPRFAEAIKHKPLTPTQKQHIVTYVNTVAAQTSNSLANLSNTTYANQIYRDSVDRGILAVTTGLTDYTSAMRQTIRDVAYGGFQVYYPSGYHRRLDTAARQNIIDGARQINQNASIMMGEELNYNAIELSAHLASAPDHEPVQGRIFLKSEFEKMQSGASFVDIHKNAYEGFRRPFGEWNCMHIAMAFDTRYCTPRYTEQQLADWAKANAEGCEIGGKTYTIYQARQLMRNTETSVRHWKDVGNAARISGDRDLQIDAQRKINTLVAQYAVIANAAGQRMQKDRMTVDGYRAVKVPAKGGR